MSKTFCSFGDGMLSLEDIAVVKLAILICNDPELKREILCTPHTINKKWYDYDQKGIWNEIIEKKAAVILRKLGLPEALQAKVIGAVLPIGMRMVIWAEYHEGTIRFSREFSIYFISISFFTPQGMIDNKKAAEELMNDNSLSIQQKYKLACLYCLIDDIIALYRQVTTTVCGQHYMGLIRDYMHIGLVKFWSYYLKGELDSIKGEKTRAQYMLEKVVESGSKAEVEYCLEQTNLTSQDFDVVYAALEAVRHRIERRNDWIVFRNRRNDGRKETWVPSEYYVDILFFLLSKMREDQQIEFLKKDIEGINYETEQFEDHRSRILEYFLSWPYQDHFMKVAKLMWEFLPKRNYAFLLLEICNTIEPKRENNVKYGEEKRYDYRGLLKEFWHQSPERFKRYVFSKLKVECDSVGLKRLVKISVVLLKKILMLENFIHEDEQNIKLILASAVDKEKEGIFSSEEWINICIELMKGEKLTALDTFVLNSFSSKEEEDGFKRDLIYSENAWHFCFKLMEEEKWDVLDRFVLNCCSYKEEANKFKRWFIFTKEAQRICIDFVKNDKWYSAESAIKWSGLPGENIYQMKKRMIYSHYGRVTCVNLIVYYEKIETIDKFARWCFLSEEEVKAFKKELILTDEVMIKCAELVTNSALEVVDDFITFFLSSEEIKEFKEYIAYGIGSEFCGRLISNSSYEYKFDEQGRKIGKTCEFKGGKWEKVEKFLTWCFSSEKEIIKFKKEKFKEERIEIYNRLVESSQWEEAENFFAWLGLLTEEIKELKKSDFFNNYSISYRFRDLMCSETMNLYFYDFGSKQEALELLLRWYLPDKKTVIEFDDDFKRKYLTSCSYLSSKAKAVLKNFDLAITQRLIDLDEQKIGVKRKSGTSSSSKRLRN